MDFGLRTAGLSPPFDEKLETIAASGLTAAELSFNYEPEDLDWRNAARGREIRAEAERLGLVLTGHAPDCYWLTDPEEERCRATVAELAACLSGMAAFGTVAAVLHACPFKPVIPGREGEQKDALLRALMHLAPVCEDAGVQLLIETMRPGRITSSLDVLIDVVTEVDSPGIGICVDVNHLNLSEHLGPAIRRAGKRVGEFHLSDNHGEKEEHLMIGSGAIDWDEVAAAIAAIGFDGLLILETNTFDSGRFPSRVDAAADAGRELARRIADHARQEQRGDG